MFIRSIPLATLLASLFLSLPVFAQGGRLISHDPVDTWYERPVTIDVASPNQSSRDADTRIDSIVVHTTEGGLSGSLSWLQNPVSQVSAHFVIASNGDIYELVDTSRKAWHATYYNSRSIGIEMVGYANSAATWNRANVNALIDLISWLTLAYPTIPLERPAGDAYDYPGNTYNAPGLVGHGQIQPWNKTDPGPYFAWDSVIAGVQARQVPIPEPTSVGLLLAGLGGLACRGRNARRKQGR